MKQKLLFFLIILCGFCQSFTAQTHPHVYSAALANNDSNNPSVTLTNFSTCQTSASLTADGGNYGGNMGVEYAIEVNGVLIASNLNGPYTADLTPYLPIISVLLRSDSSTSWWLDANAWVTIDSPLASMPVQGPTVSNVNVCYTTLPYTVTATLNSGATTLKWYRAAVGGLASFTAPVITTAGLHTVYVSQADASGCESVRVPITIDTTIGPTVITQPVIVQLNASGTATVTAAQVDNGSTDSCGIASMTLDKTTFNCTEIGVNIVIFTVVNNNGDTATSLATVTVEDTVNPTVVTQDITVQLNATGNVVITEAQIDNGSTDNCTIDTMTLDITTFDCTNVGPNNVILTVTDVNGNSAQQSAIVTVEDTVDPTVVTQDITVQLDASGNVVITEAQIDNGSTDNCAIDTMTLDITTFDCTNVGPNNVILTVTDVNGNSAQQSAIVTVEDTVNPTALAQDITIQLDATGTATITTTDIDNGSSDNCTFTLALNNTAFDCTNVGPNTVTLTITDASGNIDTATATVTVEDSVNPTVVTQDITVQLDATGNVQITEAQIDNGSTDNCAIDTITLDITAFDCTNVGLNTVILTVTDVNGNSAQQTAIVTVEDTINPVAVAQDITIQLDATGNVVITEAQIDNGSSDNCTFILALDNTAFDCTNVGPNTVTLTITDASGNIDTATATVTVEDTVNPTVVTQDITVQLDATGNVVITEAQIDNGSTDNCTIDTMTLDITAFDCTNVGPNTVTLTVTDVNGNSAQQTAMVTVQDTVNPIVITQDITVQLDATGNVVITEAQIDNSSTDNCAIDTITLSDTAFDCTNVGPNTVTLTVTDVNGNTATNTAVVTVQDTFNPIVITQNITVQLDATGNVVITEAQIDNGSTDNCTIDTLILDIDTFNCTNLGANTVTLTVTDVNGNSAQETAIVTVEDIIDPVAIAQDITIQLDPVTGLASITAAQVNNGSSDNCTFTLSVDIADFDCTDLGDNAVELTVTDTSGNTASATAIVTVEDVTAPVVITQPVTLTLNAAGLATLLPVQVDGGSTDNCTIASRTVSPNSFNCTNTGSNTVTLTVTDNSGNVSQATAIVTVTDVINPVADGNNITVQLDATGNVTVTPQQVNDGSYDICGIANMTLDISSFDCTNIGPNTVILTVADNSGNTDTDTVVITVEDVTGPVIVPQPATIFVDANGDATLTVADVNGGTTDNCGVQTVTIHKTAFDCGDLGNNNVIITAKDVNGNTTKATAVVTVADNIAPTAIAQDIEVLLNTNGFVTVTPEMVNNGSTDNCSVDDMSLDISTFSCAEIGPNTVTLTVTDKSGNTDTVTAVITVLPVPVPVTPSLSQVFCTVDDPIITDIDMTSGYVVWYEDATSTTPLTFTTPLKAGTYYAATKYGNCYSDRIAITVTLNDPPAPVGDAIQYICIEKEYTIADLMTIQQDVVWYDSLTGGMPLSASTVLEHEQMYYSAFVDKGCESSKRLEVQVIVRYCDVVVHNAVSANGDGKNDYFSIEGASSFKDNKLEIFNRWGVTAFEAANYGFNGNFFKGYANTGVGASGNGLLPVGTYYYVFSFTNHDGQRMTKSGFLHLTY